jgi:hypothetical protein
VGWGGGRGWKLGGAVSDFDCLLLLLLLLLLPVVSTPCERQRTL